MNEQQHQKLRHLAEYHDALYSEPFFPSWQSRVDYERQCIVGRAFHCMLETGISRTEAAQWAYDQASQFAARHNQQYAETNKQIYRLKRLTSLGYKLDVSSFALQAKTSVLVLTHFLKDE